MPIIGLRYGREIRSNLITVPTDALINDISVRKKLVGAGNRRHFTALSSAKKVGAVEPKPQHSCRNHHTSVSYPH
jgi:hypothetical protein